MTMRKYFAIIMMACILITGCGSAKAEQTAVEATTEQTAVEATAEQTAVEATTEQTAVEATTEQTAVEATTEQAAVEATTEQAATSGTADVYYDDGTIVNISWEKSVIKYRFSDGSIYEEDEESWYDGAMDILNDPLKNRDSNNLQEHYGENFYVEFNHNGKKIPSNELPDSTRIWLDVSVGDWKFIHDVETGAI